MINGQRPETSPLPADTNLYRLVKQNNYAVLAGAQYQLESCGGRPTSWYWSSSPILWWMRRCYPSPPFGWELLLRLAVIGDVRDVLYMRTCQAQLGEYVNCLLVPEGALYTQNNATGVVVVSETAQNFVPVTVHRQENGKAYVSPVQTGLLTARQTVRLFK